MRGQLTGLAVEQRHTGIHDHPVADQGPQGEAVNGRAGGLQPQPATVVDKDFACVETTDNAALNRRQRPGAAKARRLKHRPLPRPGRGIGAR